MVLKAKFKLPFYNTSRWTFASLVGDPEGVADNLGDYIEHFSPDVRPASRSRHPQRIRPAVAGYKASASFGSCSAATPGSDRRSPG